MGVNVGVWVGVGVREGLLVGARVGVFEGLGVDVGVIGLLRAAPVVAVGEPVGVGVNVSATAGRVVGGLPWQFVVPESVNVFPASGVNFQL